MEYSQVLLTITIVIYIISLCVTISDSIRTASWMVWLILVLFSCSRVKDEQVIHLLPVLILPLVITIIDNSAVTLGYISFVTIYLSDLTITGKVDLVAITGIYVGSIIIALATERQWITDLVSLNCTNIY